VTDVVKVSVVVGEVDTVIDRVKGKVEGIPVLLTVPHGLGEKEDEEHVVRVNG